MDLIGEHNEYIPLLQPVFPGIHKGGRLSLQHSHQFNMIMHMRIIGEISSIMNLQRHRPLFIKKFHKVPFPPTFLPLSFLIYYLNDIRQSNKHILTCLIPVLACIITYFVLF